MSESIPYDQIQKKREELVGTSVVGKRTMKRLERREKLQEERSKEKPPEFTICRRVSRAKPETVTRLDRIDICAMCGTEVYYTVTHSQGIDHICIVCAAKLRQKGFKPLDALDMSADFEGASDEELFKWLEQLPKG